MELFGFESFLVRVKILLSSLNTTPPLQEQERVTYRNAPLISCYFYNREINVSVNGRQLNSTEMLSLQTWRGVIFANGKMNNE